ncbi:MAG: ATP-binding protein [Bacteroidota bacterium]|nr:ATP-binding protein [Bacteroidota bacterium]
MFFNFHKQPSHCYPISHDSILAHLDDLTQAAHLQKQKFQPVQMRDHDPYQVSLMERVIQNLLDNAVKNTPENESIRVALKVTDKDLIFSIENSGNTLPDSLVKWINSTEKGSIEYANRPMKQGLGLVIIKRILMLHNTNLEAITTGNINTFSFSLPVYNQ